MFCKRVQEFLAQSGIVYEEKDITQDEAAFNELTGMGFYSTPVTLIDGEAVVGFDRARLEEKLAS